MVMQQEQTDQAFAFSMADSYARKADGGALNKVRQMAWEQYQSIGLPERRDEIYRYIPLRNLYDRPFSPAQHSTLSRESIQNDIYPECQGSLIVFVNGCYSPELSDTGQLADKAIVSSLPEAMRPYGAFLNSRWIKSLQNEKDAFAALNGALHQHGAFIYIPPRANLVNPIQILHVIDCDEGMMAMPRLHLFVGSQAKALLCERTLLIRGEGVIVNSAIDIAVEENASLEYSSTAFNQPKELWNLRAIRATLKRDARFRTYSVTSGAGVLREDYCVSLQGENGEAILDGAWLLDEGKQAHVNILMDHAAPHCRSSQMFKGAVAGSSRSSFQGKIYVHREAQKTDAFQLNNNLVLSDGAQADSKPNLEIFADDVKASHGATVGPVNEEHIFYLRTRGCTAEEAQNLLVMGYLKEVIDLLPFHHQKDEAQTIVHQLLKKRGV